MSASILSADISALFAGLSDKVIARLVGRPFNTIRDCRGGRSRWRAEDIIRASANSEIVRTRALALLSSLETR